MATADATRPGNGLLRLAADALAGLGDLSAFAGRILAWTVRPPSRGALTPVFYRVGVQSIPVVALTGFFIGMVLAVQSYGEFAAVGMGTKLGSIVNMSVV